MLFMLAECRSIQMQRPAQYMKQIRLVRLLEIPRDKRCSHSCNHSCKIYSQFSLSKDLILLQKWHGRLDLAAESRAR